MGALAGGFLTNIAIGAVGVFLKLRGFYGLNDPFTNFIFNLVLVAVLGALMYQAWGRNLGHYIIGLKVISSETGEDYETASNGFMREGLKGLISIFIIPAIWILWDEDNQNLYDKMLNVYVVYG